MALGVPQTDVADVTQLAQFDNLAGFEDEVGMIHGIAHHFEYFGLRKGVVGLEFTFLTQSMMRMVTHPHAKPEDMRVEDATPVLSELRLVKEAGEIERLREAARVAEAGINAALEAVKPGLTESQLAAEAEHAMRQAGAEGFWRTYVCSGPRTNIAHGLPSHRRLERGDLVMIDLHPIVNGYSSDMCRTMCIGKPTAEQQVTYNLFLKGQQATIAKVKAGVTMQELEQTLHGTLKEGGHTGHIFGPPIHGVGIDFEEPPLPAGHAFFHGEKEPKPLDANVVIAVGNCGLYTGSWGVRIEDTVVVTHEGPLVLTGSPGQFELQRWIGSRTAEVA